MSIKVTISNGRYRGELVEGTFTVIKPWKNGAGGGFITVHNPNPKQGHPTGQRITCTENDLTYFDAEGNELGDHVVIDTGDEPGTIATSTNYEQIFMQAETEDEALTRIAETFAMVDVIVDSCAKGTIRGLVVSGPPGCGKSFGVEKTLQTANLFRTIAGKEPEYEILTGGMSPIGLYEKLYYNREPQRVLVFDDCDSVLFEEESLSLLKGALNSGDRRRIAWNKKSRSLESNEIPDAFDFEGSVIFLSNVDFERTIAKESRIANHLAAIMSRCHYMDLEISSTRDLLLRIRQVVRDGMLTNYNFSPEEEAMVVKFIIDNVEYLREVSLRMVKKIADFVKTSPHNWYKLAEATCLTREAKFKRLLEKSRAAEKLHGVQING